MHIEIWWIWLAFAAILVIGEIFTEGFFLFCFGTGALVAAILALIGLGPAWQWIAFIIISGVLFLVARRFADRLTKKQPPGIGADRMIGKDAVVLESIDNDSGRGSVRVMKEEWKAESESGETIPKGTKVIVVRIDGTHLIVKLKEKGA